MYNLISINIMNESNVKTNSFIAWVLAARPKTLIGAVVPVMIGIAASIAQYGDYIRIGAAILCVIFALVMQVDANFVNDYFDFMKGTDDEKRLGPKRACSQGWITAIAMRRGLFYTTLLACLFGLPLVYYGGWEMLLIGFACVLFCFLYTISLSYIGMGDVLVLVFFGLIPVSMTYWLVSPPTPIISIPGVVLILSLACGLIIDTLLIVNNYRDIDNDRRTGKKTLIVRIGARGGRYLYLIVGIIAVLLNIFASYISGLNAMYLTLLYIPFHASTYIEMCRIGKGVGLNKVLGKTARNMLIYGVLVSIGLLL